MIPETFPEDAGKYMCKATSMAGSASSSAELIVRASVIPPSFTERLYDISIREGEPVKLIVRVAGQPAPEVTWYREGQQLVSSPDFEIVQDGKPMEDNPQMKFIHEDDNYTLLIYEVRAEDAGKYACVAINNVGKATCTASLNVQIPVQSPETVQPLEEALRAPECTQPPQNLVIDEGEPVTFTCKITGSPAPTVTWYRNNQIVKPSKYFHMESTPDGVHILSILEAFPEDTGIYKCVARNKAGETTVTCQLKVYGLESEHEHVTPTQLEQPPQIVRPITNTSNGK
ncbi:titin-like [Mya arenaria]|uniref:titin-like n=1 Tax=Mya arenaria TaxID=6604 RepID=UPI0022E78E76|nr:titin-like [Mya arenaria]